jgi:hypothetical protein
MVEGEVRGAEQVAFLVEVVGANGIVDVVIECLRGVMMMMMK